MKHRSRGQEPIGPKKILFFVPGYEWKTIERTAFRSIQECSKNGVKCQVCLSENSPLDLKLDSNLYSKLYFHTVSNAQLLSSVSEGIFLKRLIKEQSIELVHFFDLRHLSGITVALRGFPGIPLILSVNHEILQSFRKLWFRPMVSRLDKIIISSSELIENIWMQMLLHSRKCVVIPPLFNPDGREQAETKSSIHSGLNVATYLSPVLSSTEAIDSLCRAIEMANLHLGSNFSLTIFMDKVPSKSYFAEHLHKHLAHNFKNFKPEIIEFEGDYPDLSQVEIWAVSSYFEEIEDFALLALKNKIPLLAPRMPSYMELIGRSPFLGDTFKKADAREMGHKLKNIELNYSKLQEEMAQVEDKLPLSILRHDSAGYGQSLNQIYGRTFRTRLALLLKHSRLRSPGASR